ncbi:MAG: CysS/YqeB C-terminal domain-containing protein, partial [Pseudonocardiaceae bacterium]
NAPRWATRRVCTSSCGPLSRAAVPLLGFVVLAHVPGWIAALPWFPNQEKIAEPAEVLGPKATVALVAAGVLVGGFVLLGLHGEELAREKTDLKPHRPRAGFEAHGYDWHERDPYGEKFTRWIDGSSGLSQDAHAILRARQTAIESGDADDRYDLRRELSRHGVFVGEESTRQYWRTAQ